MTEESLEQMSISELFDIMVKAVNELLDMHKHYAHVAKTAEKRHEIELIQKVIAKKRSGQIPLS